MNEQTRKTSKNKLLRFFFLWFVCFCFTTFAIFFWYYETNFLLHIYFGALIIQGYNEPVSMRYNHHLHLIRHQVMIDRITCKIINLDISCIIRTIDKDAFECAKVVGEVIFQNHIFAFLLSVTVIPVFAPNQPSVTITLGFVACFTANFPLFVR